MAEDSQQQILSTDDLEAALAEVESLAPASQAADDASGAAAPEAAPAPAKPSSIVPIPIPIPGLKKAKKEPAEDAEPKSADTPPAVEPVAAAAAPAKPVAEPPSQSQAPVQPPKPVPAPAAESTSGKDEAPAKVPRMGLLKRVKNLITGKLPKWKGASQPENAHRASALYRFVDIVLEVINRPFSGLGSGAKRMVGIISIVTIVLSVAAALYLPRFASRQTALHFVEQRLVAAKNPPPATPEVKATDLGK